MHKSIPSKILNKITLVFILLACFILASSVYFAGINGRHIPNNGDEEVYFRITRLTALEGHWLPLQSDLNHTRNTKPPLLFWQGLISTHWGADFKPWRLRYPNVIYTLLTALLITFLTTKILLSKDNLEKFNTPSTIQKAWIKGAYAGLIWLGFWSTFRYGRPFLTTAPETFWMFCPVVILLCMKSKGFESRWIFPITTGLFWGLGLLTKSFMLLIPAGLALSSIYLMYRQWSVLNFLKQDAYKLIMAGLLSLLLFGLWFLLDPDPKAIWQEFILLENMGKIEQSASLIHYFHQLVLGNDSIINLLIGFLLNTGLFLIPMIGLLFYLIRSRNKVSFEEKALWLWIALWFFVFSLPDQRSARYLAPTMPCLAILMALHWDGLKPWIFKLSHGVTLIITLSLLFVAYGFFTPWDISNNTTMLVLAAAVFLIALICSIFGIISTKYSRSLFPFTVLAIFASLTCLITPINHSHFSEKSRILVKQNHLAVPSNFKAGHESYQFDFPQATMLAYADNDPQIALNRLLAAHEFVVWRGLLSDKTPVCDHCIIIDSRLELLGRQNLGQLKAIYEGKLADMLVAREWLIQRAPYTPSS